MPCSFLQPWTFPRCWACLSNFSPWGWGDEGAFALRQEILRLRAQEEEYIVANRAIVDDLYASGAALVAAASDDTNAATREAEDANTIAVYLLLALNIAGILGTVLIVWLFVLKKFVRRVDTLADRMFTMAEGDLKVDIPIDGKDENRHDGRSLGSLPQELLGSIAAQ